MATKQFWTLANSNKNQTAEDILSPFIRFPMANERRQPVFKGRQQVFGTATDNNGPVPNQDHADFVAWLGIKNHTRKTNEPEYKANKTQAELFMSQHPEYKIKRAWRKNNTLAKSA